MKNTDQAFQKNLRDVTLGDHRAFRQFYDHLYPTVYRFTRYFLPLGEDCDEVVSEVFCIFWQNRVTLNRIDHFDSYLYTVCRNECWHYMKQKDKFRHITSIDDMPVDLAIHPDYTEDGILEKELFEMYKKAINQLPERCKLIFLLVREEKLKHKEISKILNITEGTVEQQMNIAIKKILVFVRKLYPSFGNQYIFRPKQSV